MGLFDFLRRPDARQSADVRADAGSSAGFVSLDDPRIVEFMRLGHESASGAPVNVLTAMRNPAMFRAVSLISNSIGMLPLHLIDKETNAKAKDHSLYKILHRRPNGWQSAFDFRALMQLRALVHGNAYARITRSFDLRTGKPKVAALIPLPSTQVTPTQNDDLSVVYKYQPSKGGAMILPASEIFHLRGMSLDGLSGFSLVKQARDAIGLALSAELAAGRLFKNGSFVGGALKHPGKLSDPAYVKLSASMAEKEGAANAGKTLILEEGMDYTPFGTSARDAQMTDLRKLQVEEIARISGVPRPLLMVDETSWGSGIEALGQFFVAYALGPWFEAWQQAVERSLLDDDDQDEYAAKFNPGALLRGSLKDQSDYLAKALGAGGHAPWMWADEARDVMDLQHREAPPHVMGQAGKTAIEDDPKPSAKKPPKKPVSEDDDDED